MGNKQKGFTYLEVMLALIIIGIVIVPIGSSMVSSIKTVLYSKTIHQASLNSKTLMKVVKEKINSDVAAQTDKGDYDEKIKTLQEFLGNNISILEENTEFQYIVGVWRVARNEDDIDQIDNNRVLLLSNEKGISINGMKALTSLVLENKDTLIPAKPVQCDDEIGSARPLESGDGNLIIQLGLDPSQSENDKKTQKDYYGIYKDLGKDKVNPVKVDVHYSGADMIMEVNGESKSNPPYNTIYIDAKTLTTQVSSVTRTIRVTNQAQQKPLHLKVRDPHNQVRFVQDAGNIKIQFIDEIQVPHNYIIGILVKDHNDKIIEKLVDLYSSY